MGDVFEKLARLNRQRSADTAAERQVLEAMQRCGRPAGYLSELALDLDAVPVRQALCNLAIRRRIELPGGNRWKLVRG
jgi:hypothetical protein